MLVYRQDTGLREGSDGFKVTEQRGQEVSTSWDLRMWAGGGSDLSGTPRVTPRTTKREASEDTALTQARVHEASKGTFRNVRVKGNRESSEIPGKGAPPTACLGESGQQRRGWVHSTETPRAPPRRATGLLGGSGGTDLARKGDSGFLGETGSETDREAGSAHCTGCPQGQVVGGAQWESSELRVFPGQERGGRPAGELLPGAATRHRCSQRHWPKRSPAWRWGHQKGPR